MINKTMSHADGWRLLQLLGVTQTNVMSAVITIKANDLVRIELEVLADELTTDGEMELIRKSFKLVSDDE